MVSAVVVKTRGRLRKFNLKESKMKGKHEGLPLGEPGEQVHLLE